MSQRKFFFCFFQIIFSFICAVFLNSALAEPSKKVAATLVAAQESIDGVTPFWVAIELKMKSGWHTYWMNPGDSGAPITLDWKLPNGFTAGPIVWPLPHRLPVGPLLNFGYEGNAYLVVQIRPHTSESERKSGSHTAVLSTHARWLVCEKVCIPESETLNLTLPVRTDEVGSNRSAYAEAIENTLSDQPKPIESEGVHFKFLINESNNLIFNFRASEKFFERWQKSNNPHFYPADDIGWNYAAKQIKGKTSLTLPLKKKHDPSSFTHPRGLLELPKQNGKSNWYSIGSFPPTEAPATPTLPESGWIRLLLEVVAAFLGGLILNLMPCVFPVLGIKVLHLVRYSEKNRSEIRKSTFIYLLGCVSTFWALALILQLFRTSGSQLGWGFQLQSPGFVTLLTLILWTMTLNLLGVFEVRASTLENISTSFANKEAKKAKLQDSKWSSFFSGVLTTMVATPCTAPFMGSAIAYALTQNTFANLTTFTALGIGMAFPFVILSLFPQWLKLLPKPGRWMERLKKGFSLPLALTSLWLLSIYLKLNYLEWSLLLLKSPIFLSILCLSLTLFQFGKMQKQSNKIFSKNNKSASFLFIIFSLFTIYFTYSASTLLMKYSKHRAPPKEIGQGNPLGNQVENASSNGWKTFTPDAVKQARQEGKAVFIDFTAEWCITCQVNKKVALDRSEVIAAFNEKEVVRFVADWTHENEAISRTLQGFGRSGVPLYILYLPGSSTPKILPQILTPAMMIREIKAIPTPR